MTPDRLFDVFSTIVLIGWLALILAPLRRGLAVSTGARSQRTGPGSRASGDSSAFIAGLFPKPETSETSPLHHFRKFRFFRG